MWPIGNVRPLPYFSPLKDGFSPFGDIKTAAVGFRTSYERLESFNAIPEPAQQRRVQCEVQ